MLNKYALFVLTLHKYGHKVSKMYRKVVNDNQKQKYNRRKSKINDRKSSPMFAFMRSPSIHILHAELGSICFAVTFYEACDLVTPNTAIYLFAFLRSTLLFLSLFLVVVLFRCHDTYIIFFFFARMCVCTSTICMNLFCLFKIYYASEKKGNKNL